MKAWIGIVASAAIGFAIAQLTGSSSSSPAPAPVASRADDREAMAELRAELRQVQRQVQTRPAQVQTAAIEHEQPVEEPAAPSPAQRQAHERATSLVASAQSARRWSADDAVALRRLLPALAADQRDQVVRTLIVAVNRDELAVETAELF